MTALRPISALTCGSFGLANNVTADVQFKSIAITVVWTLAISAIILMFARTAIGLHVDDHVEIEGLDLSEHGEHG